MTGRGAMGQTRWKRKKIKRRPRGRLGRGTRRMEGCCAKSYYIIRELTAKHEQEIAPD